MTTTTVFDQIESLLNLDGTMPERIVVVDVTPEGHATRLFAVRLDYGWAETIGSADYEHVANAYALALGEILSIPVETTLQV